MVRARRAKRSPARAVVPAVVVALVLVAGVVWWRPWSGDGPSAVPGAATSTGSPGAAATDAAASPSPTGSPSSTEGSDSVAVALRGCRSTVADGEDMVRAARQGVGHWAAHVDAQKQADRGEITEEVLGKKFAVTRLAGNDLDVPMWTRANTAWDADEQSDDPAGACASPSGASTEQAAVFEHCQVRADALTATLSSADDGMADWLTHLTHMRASRDHYVHNAQGVWLADYGKSGPHIAAWTKADATFTRLQHCA